MRDEHPSSDSLETAPTAFRCLTRRLRRGSGLRPSLQTSPFLRVSPVNPAGNAIYELRTHQVIHVSRKVLPSGCPIGTCED